MVKLTIWYACPKGIKSYINVNICFLMPDEILILYGRLLVNTKAIMVKDNEYIEDKFLVEIDIVIKVNMEHIDIFKRILLKSK